jgi:hypothetical protein
MKEISKNGFIEKSTKTLGGINDAIQSLPSIKMPDLKSSETALIIVDMIKWLCQGRNAEQPAC